MPLSRSVPFPDASGRRLEFPFALMRVELLLQVCLSILGLAERAHRDLELPAAKCAYPNDRGRTEPFHYLQSGLCSAHNLYA